ncbi:unnamed protein product [Nezara viridula]|uniref:Protein FRA10AC1 n=1 Tax=Nezara viridula TaxID=85310 RepID=A0A9P0DZ91_NEZVI|nr:unnamed protein product [Nezara viridula]
MDMSKYSFPRSNYLSWNPYELHKHLINTYVLNRKGNTALLRRDNSKDKRDIDIIRENHKFVWEDDDIPSTWEERLAKKYYDKLFKEFCITDMSKYKENKFAMRWQTEQELVTGKGQFVCANKACSENESLRTWEVNFAYKEDGERKNALVKLRLCSSCSKKLNYAHKKTEIKRPKRKNKLTNDKILSSPIENISEGTVVENIQKKSDEPKDSGEGEEIWKAPLEDVEEISREEEFEKYLEHLLL